MRNVLLTLQFVPTLSFSLVYVCVCYRVVCQPCIEKLCGSEEVKKVRLGVCSLKGCGLQEMLSQGSFCLMVKIQSIKCVIKNSSTTVLNSIYKSSIDISLQFDIIPKLVSNSSRQIILYNTIQCWHFR